jgi:hypothetical protein
LRTLGATIPNPRYSCNCPRLQFVRFSAYKKFMTTSKVIKHGEMYQHLAGFLKNKGIELKDGSYAQRIQNGCRILTEAINLGQQSYHKAKTGVHRELDRVRQCIHQKTAPRGSQAPPVQAAAAQPAAPVSAAATATKKRSSAKRRAPTNRTRKHS